MSQVKSTNFHEDTHDTFRSRSKTTNTSRSQSGSGIVHFLSSIFAAAFDQWQQLVMFLSPYVEIVRGIPKKLFCDVLMPTVECTYNTLHDKFSDYTFVKFVADVVEMALTLALLPLMITVAILRAVRNKSLGSCAMCREASTGACSTINNVVCCSHQCGQWLVSSAKGILTWSKTTCTELRNGDITWKDAWNSILDCIKTELRNGCDHFGENSAFARIVYVTRIGDVLNVLHLECDASKKEE